MTQMSDGEHPLDPAARRLVNRVRWMMLLSGTATMIGIAVVLGVVGYRLFRVEGSPPAAVAVEAVALLPANAKILSVAPSEDRIVVTIEVAGVTEVRTFDLRTLRPAGRLRFATQP